MAATLAVSSCGMSVTSADEGQAYIVPGLQWMNYDNELNYPNEIGHFVGIGYDISSRLSAELSVADLNPETPNKRELDQDLWKFDIIYDLDLKLGKFGSFVTGGVGLSNIDGDNNEIWDIGAGLKLPLSDRLTWRTSVRNYYFSRRNTEDQDLGIETGLEYRFGAKKRINKPVAMEASPVKPAASVETKRAMDSDGDGIEDGRDRCEGTPRSYAVDADGCPIPVEEVARVELLVNFDFDRAEVKSEYLAEIESVARFMNQYPDVVVELEGHTDSRGTDVYNLDLSQRRADAVMAVLVDRYSVAASRVSARGLGESQPIANNATDKGRAENRRVITVIVKTLQKYQPK